MNGKFEFCGKQFQYPEEIANERVVAVYKCMKAVGDDPWWSDSETLNKTMRLLLDGPHDEMDWGKASFSLCVEAYKGFFPFYAKKTGESGNS